jgi:hypothetical protein
MSEPLEVCGDCFGAGLVYCCGDCGCPYGGRKLCACQQPVEIDEGEEADDG